MSTPVTLVASDLDRTLIYSAAALGLTMPDAGAPRLLCVEVHEHKPLSYVTETRRRAARRTERGRRLRAHHHPHPQAVPAHPTPGPAVAVRDLRQRRTPARGRRVRPRLGARGGRPHRRRVRAPGRGAGPPAGRRRPARGCARSGSPRTSSPTSSSSGSCCPSGWVKELAAWAGAARLDGLAPGPQDLRRAEAAHQERGGRARSPAAPAPNSPWPQATRCSTPTCCSPPTAAWRPGHGELADAGWQAPRTEALAERGVARGRGDPAPLPGPRRALTRNGLGPRSEVRSPHEQGKQHQDH